MQTQTAGALGNLYSRPLTETVGVRWMFISFSPPAHSRASGNPVFLCLALGPRFGGDERSLLLRHRLQRLHAHLGENIADRAERTTHVLRIKPSDAADAETVRHQIGRASCRESG